MSLKEAADRGIPHQNLDKLYKSALHTDTSQAVFQTPQAQARLQQAYAALLNDLGTFLTANHFRWGKQTKCFNRIYFSTDGSVDYFLYNFAAGQLLPEQEKEFKRLVNQFIEKYKLPLTGNRKFAQCSPVRYSDE